MEFTLVLPEEAILIPKTLHFDWHSWSVQPRRRPPAKTPTWLTFKGTRPLFNVLTLLFSPNCSIFLHQYLVVAMSSKVLTLVAILGLAADSVLGDCYSRDGKLST
jgi:hypothetical protein